MGSWHVMQDGASVGQVDGTRPPPVFDGQVLVPTPSPASAWLPVPDGAGGYTVEAAPPPPPVVPQRVTPAQMRIALLRLGYQQAVDAYVAALDAETLIRWEFAEYIDRYDPMILAAQVALGLTDEQADALFTLAASI